MNYTPVLNVATPKTNWGVPVKWYGSALNKYPEGMGDYKGVTGSTAGHGGPTGVKGSQEEKDAKEYVKNSPPSGYSPNKPYIFDEKMFELPKEECMLYVLIGNKWHGCKVKGDPFLVAARHSAGIMELKPECGCVGKVLQYMYEKPEVSLCKK